MLYNDDFRQDGFGYGDGIDININNTNTNMNTNHPSFAATTFYNN